MAKACAIATGDGGDSGLLGSVYCPDVGVYRAGRGQVRHSPLRARAGRESDAKKNKS